MPISALQPNPICIVDDDASVRDSIVKLLDSDGLTAQSFESADAFFVHASNHTVPLVVLDVRMPSTSGLQVQTWIRQERPQTKVIVMTGWETSAIRSKALEAGAIAFLAKPFDTNVFLSIVRQALLLLASEDY
jgi:two-component system response regulator FixJ